ncbi:MAG: hypothetical protein ACLS67_22210 [Anaerobutyricum soehngenii]
MQQQRHLAEITNQIHGHAHALIIDIIEQQNGGLGRALMRELMAGLRAIHTFTRK